LPPLDRYRLFAQKVYPALVRVRTKTGGLLLSRQRLAIAMEPVLMLGVSLLQYLEATPDVQAVDLPPLSTPAWNFALNRQVGDELFHPTTLVHFRQRFAGP